MGLGVSASWYEPSRLTNCVFSVGLKLYSYYTNNNEMVKTTDVSQVPYNLKYVQSLKNLLQV